MDRTAQFKSAETSSAAGASGLVTADDLVARAWDMVPAIRARFHETSQLRRLPDATIEELQEAELWRLVTPMIYGGVGGTPAQASEIMTALATGCGSTSWVAGLYMLGPYFMASMSDRAQEDFFAVEGARSIQAFNPSGQAVACPDGYRLSGQWRFCTGQHHAHFAILSTIIIGDGGAPVGPATVLVPREQMELVDDWDVSGLRGSGSNSLTANGLFVPAHRVTMLSDVMAGASGSTVIKEDPTFRIPFVPLFTALSSATPIGLATRALEIFGERIQKRTITYTNYASQAGATLTHLQMAEAHMKLDQACFHRDRSRSTVEAMAEKPGSLFDRAQCKADTGMAVKLCRDVAEIVQDGSGASSISMRDPLRHIIQDLEALSLHAFLLHTTNAEIYGRILCGQDPNTDFV